MLFCPLMCALVLIIVLGPRSAQFFAAGFLFGYLLEHLAMAYCLSYSLVRFSATTLAPEGWYPLEIPLERIVLLSGWADLRDAPVLGTFAGLLLSGLLCGGIAFAVSRSAQESDPHLVPEPRDS